MDFVQWWTFGIIVLLVSSAIREFANASTAMFVTGISIMVIGFGVPFGRIWGFW